MKARAEVSTPINCTLRGNCVPSAVLDTEEAHHGGSRGGRRGQPVKEQMQVWSELQSSSPAFISVIHWVSFPVIDSGVERLRWKHGILACSPSVPLGFFLNHIFFYFVQGGWGAWGCARTQKPEADLRRLSQSPLHLVRWNRFFRYTWSLSIRLY